MGQRTLDQEPLSVPLGGTNSRTLNGVLAGSTATALKSITGSDDAVLRSNGTGWEYASGGRLIQILASTYGLQVAVNSQPWVPTGLTGQITPRRSDSKIVVAVKQNGIGRQSNGTQGYGNFRLLWNGNQIAEFGYPFAYQGGIFYSLGLGNASTFVTVTPGNTNLQSFATQFQNQNGSSSMITQWGNVVASSMLLMEVAP